MATSQGAPGIRSHMVPAIIVTFLCFFPTGIPAIVYAYQVSAKIKAGDYDGAVEASKLARVYVITSLVIFAILLAITGVAYLAGFRGGSG
jgi:Interferon-induced transmembrane protein